MAIPTYVPKRIHLLSTGDVRQEEAVAAGAITPGHLVDIDSSGTLLVHPTAGGWAEKAFAIEDALRGKIISDAYAAADQVLFVLAKPGDVIYAFLAAGENVDKSEFLTSNGDGALKVATGTDVRVAKSLEAIDNSDTGAVDVRCKVRVL